MKVREILNILIFSFLFASLNFQSNAFAAEKETILLLHSYHEGLPWTDNLNKAIIDELNSENLIAPDIYVEYMDAKRFDDNSHLKKYGQYLIEKYRNIKLNLIISTDDPAFDFLVENRNSFVKNTPVVFCGINYPDYIPEGFTGIIEDIDIYSNIETILNLHPHYKKIYFFVDNSITGTIIYKQFKKVIEGNFPDLRYEYLRDYNYAELKAKLFELGADDVIFLTLFNVDKDGLLISHDEMLSAIKYYCQNTPFYGVWDFYLNKGIIGGKITSGHFHGIETVKIAKEILRGKKTSEIPAKFGPTKYIFDYKELQKFHIPERKLPKESNIINLPTSVFRQYKRFLITVGIVFVLMVLAILSLIKILRKEREYLSIIENKQKELQAALKDARKARDLQRTFLTNISHEIRTPMNAILGFAEILSIEDICAKPEGFEYLAHIKNNGNHLISIIDDIIEMSNIENDRLRIISVPVKINLLFDSLETNYEYRLRNKENLKFSVHKQLPEQDIVIETDLTKLQQVFDNLIDNAMKFTPEGKIEVTYTLKDDFVEFSVLDTGIGIRKEDVDLIFDSFGQVETGFSRKYQGTGLGLSISKAYIQKLGGKIWIESLPDNGSKFIFMLPLKYSKQEEE